MTERPILFSAPMVRAILAGQKTQTRRVVKPQPPAGTEEVSSYHHPADEDGRGPRFWSWSHDPERPHGFFIDGKWHQPCPYGTVGDRLWVRETWGMHPDYITGEEIDIPSTAFVTGDTVVQDYWRRRVLYRATHDTRYGKAEDPRRWRPSIHMPRWISRIPLEITGVRVERLQAISEADAMAEGAGPTLVPPDGGSCPHVEGFEALWSSINGAESWDANPWVWCVSFRRV